MSQKKQKEIDLESLTPEEKVKYEIAEELGLLDRVLKDGWKGTIPVHLHIRRNGSQSDFLSVRGANRRKHRVCRGIRCNFCRSGCIDLCSNQK